jgi:hypothetical protein
MPIYDVENRFSYYKSYSDNILVGPPRPTMGSSTWLRSVSGSIVSGSEEFKAATTLTAYYYEKYNQFFRSGEVRYLRLVSANQTFIDSVTPDIISLYTTGSYGQGKFIYSGKDFGVNTVFLKMYWSLDGYPVTASYTDSTVVNNVVFSKTFPFEKQYSYVARFSTENYSITAAFKESGTYFSANTVPFTVAKEKLIICLTTGSAAGVGLVNNIDAFGQGNISSFTVTSYTGSFANPTLAPKLVFGIKPSPISTIDSGNSISGYVVSNMTGAYIEGWKYGLYNGVPTNFSCVFRQNHYGQPRDMLEGRPYTKTYNNKEIGGPMDTDGGINFISGSALSGESNNYLTASIYQSTNVTAAYTVNPYGSGIFDKEYRASQPWHDDDPRVGT